ncbi:MAG: heme-copper oxidase subunit III [Candidatus Binatia bacterium]
MQGEALIPYITEPREDTGLTNSKIAIWLFLASEVMLFGAFFASYIVLRMTSTTWPHGWELQNVPLGALNTVVLITSSVTMVMAWASLERNDFPRYARFIGATVLLGGVFLVIKYFEYSAKFEHHLLPSTSTYLAIYFTMTALHGLHVIFGMGVNGYFWMAGRGYWEAGDRQLLINRVENAGLFWHFVDIVWIFLFPIMYLI